MNNLTPRINRLEPNIVIDGGMEIWPEGTSRTVVDNSQLYGACLFSCRTASLGISVTNSQQASVPASTNIPFSNQVSKTLAGTLGAATASNLTYFVEGYDTLNILNKESTVIFWVKSSVASNRSLSITNASNSHSYVQQYNIAQADTWEMKTIKLPALNTSPGTIDKTNGIGMEVKFSIVSGSNFQTASLNQWVSGLQLSGLGEDTTWLTGTNHNFSIAGVMILPGDFTGLTEANYQFLRAGRNFQDEVDMTRRYYEKSYPLSVAPGTATTSDGTIYPINTTTNTQTYLKTTLFKVEKRANPTTIVYDNNGVANQASTEISNRAASATGTTSGINISIVSSANSSRTYRYNWTADARF